MARNQKNGKLVWKNRGKYDGNFENGQRNGFGVYTYSKESAADYYEGHWKDDKKSGKGKYVRKDGSKYEGNFENDQLNGFGVLIFSKEDAEDCYEGH